MYMRMIAQLERGDSLENIGEDCELRRMRGDIQHIGLFHTESGPLIVRDSTTVLIPESGSRAILQEVHRTHLSIDMMKNLCCGRFFWPGIQKDLEDTYIACREWRRERVLQSQ